MDVPSPLLLADSIAVHEQLRGLPGPGFQPMDDVPQRNVTGLFGRLKTAGFFVPARIGCDRGQEISAEAKSLAVDTMLALSEQHSDWMAQDIVSCAWLHTLRAFGGLDEEMLDLHALQRLISPMINGEAAVDFMHAQRGHPR